MVELNPIEKALFDKISNDDLKDSLRLIRKSTIAIWSIEAPRIIQGFTDHGFDHCTRLLEWASKLLNANKGNPLSDEEMYLLIAGIYLHDIGMQCDVNKFPVIKEKAIEFGAFFDIDFTSTNANKYSNKEQIEIRKNHQYLSAAWIDFAFNNPETPLGKSIQSVPNILLLDLIDVCKYHSKLNIRECPLQFKLDTQGRKQLVASLVRFSDELDVDFRRVSLDTVRLFSMEPENKFYWWLHNLTKIELNDNILILTVSLKPGDYSQYRTFVKDTYIDHFREKNKDVLDILSNNNISISISSKSEVVEYEYAKKLPPEIEDVIKEMQKKISSKNKTSTPNVKSTLVNKLKEFPVPKPYFSGRNKEIDKLKEAFKKNTFISIDGGGGIGKTQLIAKLINELQIQERIVWFECIPNSLPDDVIKGAGFGEILKGEDKTDREKFSAFKEKIEENKLVVFLDDYQEVESVPIFKAFLRFINDYLKKGHLIVLGRNKINRLDIQPKNFSLQGLGDDDSLLHAQNLIQHSYPELKNVDIESLRSICNQLKGYPLAVDLAVYLLSLSVDVNDIIKVVVYSAQSDPNIEIISTRLLNKIFTRPDASEEEKDFLKWLSIFRGKVDFNDALSIIPKDIFDRASRQLFKRNLLEMNGGYLELHPFIREFSYDKLENKEELHRKISRYYIKKRNVEWNPELEDKIFYHLSRAKEWIKISETIINSGRDIILHGYLDRLQHMISLVKEKGIIESIFYIYEGDISQVKGEWKKALSIFESAKQSSAKEIRIEGTIKYGEILYRQGNVKESKVIFEEVISITKDTGNQWQARALNDLGLVFEFFGNYKFALIYLKKALQLRQGFGNKKDIASSLNNIGSVKSSLGKKSEALELYKKSLKIEKEIGNKSGIARSLNNIGSVKHDLGKNSEGLEMYEESLRVYKEIGDKSGIESSLNNIGSIKDDLGKKSEALELYKKSLEIVEEIGDKSGIARSLNNIGLIKSSLGKKSEALELYKKSLRIYEEIGDKSGIASSLNNEGSIKSSLGKKSEALELYGKSLKIVEEIGDKSGIARSLNNIGSVKHDLGKKSEVLELYEESLRIYEEIGDKSGIARSLNNIGSVKHDLGKKSEALELYKKSLEIVEEIGDKSGIASSLNNIGSVKSSLEKKSEALELYKKSLEIREEVGGKLGIARSLNNIGSVKHDLGKKSEALELYEKSLEIVEEIGDKLGIANSSYNIGGFLYDNNLEIKKSCFYLIKSLALFTFIGSLDKSIPNNYLSQIRKNVGNVEFESMVNESIEKLDDELKGMIDIGKVLRKPIKVDEKLGRNDPCSCGSGKKYKKCCGKMN